MTNYYNVKEIPSVAQRKADIDHAYVESLIKENAREELLSVIRNLKPDLDGASIHYTLYEHDIDLHIYGCPYETVIEQVAGPIHRAFGCNWTLKTGKRQLVLISFTEGFRIEVFIDEGEHQTCQIASKIRGFRSEEEIEALRTIKDYYVICPEAPDVFPN